MGPPPRLLALVDARSALKAPCPRGALRSAERAEYLCRYGARGPLSLERLSRLPDGRVSYALRRPWPNDQGVTTLVLEPLQFLKRLALLIPPPYLHLVRYHGVFAPHARYHPRPSVAEPSEPASPQVPQGVDSLRPAGPPAYFTRTKFLTVPVRRSLTRRQRLLRR